VYGEINPDKRFGQGSSSSFGDLTKKFLPEKDHTYAEGHA
jgi:hypothetical protein